MRVEERDQNDLALLVRRAARARRAGRAGRSRELCSDGRSSARRTRASGHRARQVPRPPSRRRAAPPSTAAWRTRRPQPLPVAVRRTIDVIVVERRLLWNDPCQSLRADTRSAPVRESLRRLARRARSSRWRLQRARPAIARPMRAPPTRRARARLHREGRRARSGFRPWRAAPSRPSRGRPCDRRRYHARSRSRSAGREQRPPS